MSARRVMINGQEHRWSGAGAGYVPVGPALGPHVGQCDGCPSGHAKLCGECRLCSLHCQSNGCGFSPHAGQAYPADDHSDVHGYL